MNVSRCAPFVVNLGKKAQDLRRCDGAGLSLARDARTMAHDTGTALSARDRTRRAWTAFWQEPGQAGCISVAPDISAVLEEHWSCFSATLPADARILDLGCGAGAVGRTLVSLRGDLSVTGVDFAKVPLTLRPRLEVLSDTAMESLPFADAGFAAATSQFGFEYSQTRRAAAETARVLTPGAPFLFLTHHAGSAVVAADRARLDALLGFLSHTTRAAFCSADPFFTAQMSALSRAHPHDTLVAELARALPPRLARPAREREAIWNAVEDALAPELCLAEALSACCVAPQDLDRWIGALRDDFNLNSVSILHDPIGAPLAWIVSGVRRP
jgi:SAM-dependent methyltransferase